MPCPPSLQSDPLLVHATCAAAAPRPPDSRPEPHRASHALLPIRQNAKAFNQPLSLDTSSVTDMFAMFNVRSARALTPSLKSGPLPVHTACAAAGPFPRASQHARRPASYALLPTWQSASTFNQPLSFDTSSVTDMQAMFDVRSARALAPSLESGPALRAACAAAALRPCTLRPSAYRPAPRPASYCALFDSAGYKRPVQRQQALDPLRMGGHLGLYEHILPRRWL